MKKLLHVSIVSFLVMAVSVSCKTTETEPDVLKVFDLNEKVGAYGYPELIFETSKWIYGLPLDKKSPLNDPDGAFHAANLQPLSNVMILMGTQEGNSNRNITIPSGRYVFLPMIFSTYWHYANDKCDPTFQPATGQTLEAFLTELAKGDMDLVKTMTATLDGKEIVPDLTKYRAKTKAVSFLIAKDFNYPDCDYSTQMATSVSDGYFLLLKLPKGKHTITYNAIFPNDPVQHPADTWNLTVE